MQAEHLDWIADALGAPPHVVASAERNGDLLALAVAAGVRHLREQYAASADSASPWLADFLRSARAVFGEDDFTSRDLVEAATVPHLPAHAALAACLSAIGDGQCPAPAVLGKQLAVVVGKPAGGLVLQLTGRPSNANRYAIEGA